MAKITEIVRERIARFLYGLFIWAMKGSMPKRALKASPGYCDEHVGVACALCSTHANVRAGKILHSCMIKPPKSSQPLRSPSSLSSSWLSSSSSSSWATSANGDLLGTESGVHMSSSDDIPPWEDTKPYIRKQSMQGRIHVAKKRDIPPPISILRGKGNYKGPIPWSLHREYKDGRLILREAVAERFEYLETIRENGRLIMNLVSVDNSANCCDTIEEAGEEQEQGANNPIENENEQEGVVERRNDDRKGKRPLIEMDSMEEHSDN